MLLERFVVAIAVGGLMGCGSGGTSGGCPATGGAPCTPAGGTGAGGAGIGGNALGGAPSGGAGNTGGVSAGGTTSGGPDAPIFLSFGTSSTTLTDQAGVTFTAVLTDPQGIDNLIGGALKDQSGVSYGSFATSGQEGSYQITLDWGQANQAGMIEFPAGGSAQRTFVAEFFDAEGHSSQQTATLTLACNQSFAACAGSCIDTNLDPKNCGSCGNACAAECLNGSCAGWACFPSESIIKCDQVCGSLGKTCGTSCNGDSVGLTNDPLCKNPTPKGYSCGEELFPEPGMAWACCCQ